MTKETYNLEMTKVMFKNGKIFTSDTNQKYANAMIIDNGIIEWIGDQDEIVDFQGEIIDLQNRRVIPGIIDARIHPVLLAHSSKQIACSPPLGYSTGDMIPGLAKMIAEEGIEAWGYEEAKLEEGRTPDRHDL